ncbi:PAS domain S-box protein (plasmid) [Haloferax mediterranei ATCC 33500]|uniref:Histidine kinase n=1 Tax=Haloferax mediterranei (strain ATCC 33500 / DSM 1411 / JCM 8866 / NBRC 14739 / NCIMB 2177 / R-4) TaxID=523841 RepID=I3RAR1_HALMT|nr:PAS domain S-box protein [Haloferax mediterranei]AFK21321.1 light and oxygen sensing histidine kinase [Haloferax mediterranei ATCC 33500]AHZ24587.1 histidine kinase [Haloferax mediterranei ATCC 33500]ELZ97349.1 light and oxygen sensing histidine kinase [Haloferax mediterranei ATCC 33500]MDX5990355.1 PAS domain S-box protein [Haloferax mediterranei ATCC 33500]QCQ76986.1 PAS domain S-box protein [Haloferax mediterranei ATCC 33500]
MSRNSSRTRERIYATFADSSLDFEESVQHSLEIVADFLGVEYGFLTRITDGEQRIQQAIGSHELIQPGESCPLEEAYCRRTIQMEETLSVQDAEASPQIPSNAFETFNLGCYIGTKITVDDEVYGTVCFGDTTPRNEPFPERKALLVELLGQLISQALERRAYETKLEERNRRLEAERQRFKEITETTFDIIYRTDLAGQFTYASSSAERIIGYQPDELLGTQFIDYICESSVPKTLAAFNRVLDGHYIEQLEAEFNTKTGETVVLEINARPVYHDGELLLVQGVARDITRRVEQERELRIQHRAIEDTHIGITIADASLPGYPVDYVNEAFERLTGYTGAELGGKSYHTFLPEDVDSNVRDEIRNSLDVGESISFELLITRKDGTPLWCRTTISPVTDDQGEVTHFVGFHENVTEQERTVRLVELLNRVLRHNLRNSMNVILGNADLLRDPAVADVAAARIRRRADSLVQLSERARELKQYAQRDRSPTRLDPATLLSRIVEEHEHAFPDASIETDISTERGICAGSELEQAISELVTNALTHHPSDSAHVSLSVSDADDQVYIEVIDDGRGISPSETAFVEEGHETELEHGSSMGLWLVNWIVTRYGGSFQIGPIDNPTETGTRATLLVPAIDDEMTVEEAAQPPTALFW